MAVANPYIFFRKTVKYLNKTELKLEFEVINTETKGLPVIIVAAGSSSRMQGINKQFLTLGDKPVIVKTLLAFEKSKYISRIILVTRKEDIFALQLLAEEYSVSKLTDIVEGGNNRQESVLQGFGRLSTDEYAVLIHDGARPFVTDDIIGAVAENLNSYPAVTCGVKVKDTIKQITTDGVVEKTLQRDTLFAVQTPQGVKTSEYKDALNKVGDLSLFTDDTSIMESAGYTVKCVEGSYRNIKITTPEDIVIAESYLKEF